MTTVWTTHLLYAVAGCVLLLPVAAVAALRAGRKERLGQVLLALLLFELSVIFIVMALDLEVSPLMDSNPATVPILWAAVLAAFSLYQLLRVLRGETAPDPKSGRLDKVFLTVLIVALCIYGIDHAGFYLATSGMIVLMLLLLGEYRLKILLLSSLGWSLFAWAVFEKLLRLGLPVGSFWL